MKTLTPLYCILSLMLTQSTVFADGLYKWKDARGNTQYGDKPPANSNAQPMNLPKITIIDNYADQWKPMEFSDQAKTAQPTIEKSNNTNDSYSKLAFLAPKASQAIRANDGDVSAMISIQPPLKKGHSLVFSIDGKAAGKSRSRTKNFSGLSRGNHTIAVKVVDQRGKTVKSSSVGFNVLRSSSLSNTQSNQANKAPQMRTYQEARNGQSSN